ncbi:MAG: hypothetical protein J6K80_00955 [Oscillospiraceae bacterium]|nr:hypothetical protein [Oscillospiraceae bacterium]
MIAGSWLGISLITADETTTLWPGSLSMELKDDTYSITMMDEKKGRQYDIYGQSGTYADLCFGRRL